MTANVYGVTLSSLLDQVNVKSAPYNAKGDGVTDDTAAVQAAINAGGVTYFPAGTYLVTTLTLPSYAVLEGVCQSVTGGTQASILQLKNGTNSNLLYVAAATTFVQIRNLCLEGNKANNSSGDLIHFDDNAAFQGADLTVVDCYLDSSPGAGIYMGNRREALKVQRTWIQQCVGNGITVEGSDAGIDASLIGLNGGDGININGNAWVTRVTNCDIWQNTNGINVNNGVNMVTISGCGIDRNAHNGIVVSDTCTGVEIIGSLLHSNSQSADNTYANIQMNSTGAISVYATTFGTDSLTNMPSYAINLAAGTLLESGNVVISGATRSGYVNIAGGVLNNKLTIANGNAAGLVNITNFSLTTGQAATDTRTEAGPSNPTLATAASGDTAVRWLMNADGTQKYGSGSGASDTITGRSAAGIWYTSKSLLVGASASLGDNGSGEIQLANATTVPTTNPTGGTLIYSESGTSHPLKARDTSGNVRSLADAYFELTTNPTFTSASQTATTVTLSVAASATYLMEAGLIFSNSTGSTTPSWTGPTGATMSWNDTGTSTDYSSTIGATNNSYASSASTRMAFFKGKLTTSSTAGSLTLTLGVSAGTTTLSAGTYLRLTRVK